LKRKGQQRILLVEDDPNLSMVILDYLEMMDYSVTSCKDGIEGLREYKRNKYHLVILDVMMPRKDGFSVAEDIRSSDQKTPIIFLTAKNLKEDRIRGFQVGCDDYLAKPFSTEELILRIRAILKRCYLKNTDVDLPKLEIFSIGQYLFDPSNMILKFGSKEYTLTRKEASLLQLLCSFQNKLLPRDTAMKIVWGEDGYFVGRSMDVFISRLRKYLKSDSCITISNVHGVGFKLEVKKNDPVLHEVTPHPIE
jgi:DNA-binding response OmpR family regulator